MVDFLTRRTARNEILRRVGRPIASAGDAFGAARTMPGTGGLLGSRADVNRANKGLEPSPAERVSEFAPGPFGLGAETLNDLLTYVLPGDPGIDRVPAEDLNKMYGDLGLKFDLPMTAEAARIIADVKRAEIIRKDVLSRTASAGGTLASFAGGFVAMATDPLEVAASMIPILGAATRLGMITRFGAIRGRALAGATEGALGAALTEPFYAGLSLQMQLDYKATDALINVGFGAVLGGAFGAGAGAISRARGERLPVRGEVEPPRLDAPEAARAETRVDPGATSVTRTASDRVLSGVDPEARADDFKASVAQMAQGKTVEVPARQDVLRFDAEPAPGERLISEADNKVADDWLEANVRSRSTLTAAEQAKVDKSYRANAAESADVDDAIRRGAVPLDRDLLVWRAGDAPHGGFASMALNRATAAQFGTARPVVIPAGTPVFSPRSGIAGGEILVDAATARRLSAPQVAARAQDIAAREASPERDFSGDPEASRAADEIEDFDALNADNDDLLGVIAEMRESGALTKDAEKAAAEAEALSKQAKSMGEAARVAAACLVR